MKSIGAIRRKNTQTGFTMVEVIISALVFALAAAGIFATVSSLTHPSQESQEDVTAAFVGKKIFDNWRSQVSTDNWGSAPFNQVDAGWQDFPDSPIETIDGTTYYGEYRVDAVSNTNAIKVTVNICWPNDC